MLASFVVAGLVALSLTVDGVAQAQSSCDAAVTKAAGKKVACKLNLIARAQKTGATVDAVKFDRCATKFASSCAIAQAQGDCSAQTQTCHAIEVTADACVDDLSGETFTCLRAGNHCWFLGVQGADCDATCAAQGLVYDPATATYAGSYGTLENCQTVLEGLGVPFYTAEDSSGFAGVGCAIAYGFFPFGIRDMNPTTSGAFNSVSRACACM